MEPKFSSWISNEKNNKVNEKYGEHKYTLAVNGLDEVVLCKGYTEEIAKGTKQVKAKLRELLQEVK